MFWGATKITWGDFLIPILSRGGSRRALGSRGVERRAVRQGGGERCTWLSGGGERAS